MRPRLLRARRLRLQPGDMVVLEVADGTEPEHVRRLGERWKERFPDNPVVVLAGARLAAVISSPSPEATP